MPSPKLEAIQGYKLFLCSSCWRPVSGGQIHRHLRHCYGVFDRCVFCEQIWPCNGEGCPFRLGDLIGIPRDFEPYFEAYRKRVVGKNITDRPRVDWEAMPLEVRLWYLKVRWEVDFEERYPKGF